MSLQKTELRENFGRKNRTGGHWAGPERAGRAGPGSRAGSGWGPVRGGWGGKGTCVFLHKNVRRNRLECRFGAVCRGKNPVFFTGFFPGAGGGRYRIFPEEKIR